MGNATKQLYQICTFKTTTAGCYLPLVHPWLVQNVEQPEHILPSITISDLFPCCSVRTLKNPAQREAVEYSLYLSILGPRQRPRTSDRHIPLDKELMILKALF